MLIPILVRDVLEILAGFKPFYVRGVCRPLMTNRLSMEEATWYQCQLPA